MQNKVVIFSNNANLITKTIRKIERALLERGLFDFSFLSYSNYQDCLDYCKLAKSSFDNIVVVCDNAKIDKLVETIRGESDDLSLIDEQAIKLEESTTYRKILFIPIELDAEKFLDKFLQKKEFFSCTIFGRTLDFIMQKFEQIKSEITVEYDYKIITYSTYLHTVYYSYYIDKETLKTQFDDNFVFDNAQNLQAGCMSLLTDKNLTLSIADNITFGKLSQSLYENSDNSKTRIKGSFVLNEINSFEPLGVDKQFLDENGTVSKETTFVLAKNLVKNMQTDIGLVTLGLDCDAGRTYVAVGNKQEVHVFSSIFYGEKEDRWQNVVDFALFRLVKFLQEKY